ncbi:hypothetical protein KXW91_006727, partial [Aspergillus fumigatus]
MAKTLRYPSRPTRTEDLIQRLTSSDCDPEERKALEALAKSMIKVFQDNRRLLYVPEAAELSSAVTGEDYHNLVVAFANAIIKGTSDGNILDQKLLMNYAYVLQHAKGILSAATAQLGPVVVSLQKRLEGAINQAGNGTQYQLQLVCTLSAVLDAMIDLKIYGLDRVALHEPLREQLDNLASHQEIRLAQAATYAREALVGLPNNESSYHAFLRHAYTIAQGAAKVAGAVPTMDLSKLMDAIPDLMNVPDLIKSVIDVATDVYNVYNGIGMMAKGMKPLPKQKNWYVALRYTDMLIQAKAFRKLEEFIRGVPCCQGKEFLCGLYAQLEQAWKAGDSSMKAQVVELLQLMNQTESKDQSVQEWRKLVADTLNRSDWKDALPRIQHLRPWKNKMFKCNLEFVPRQRMKPGRLPADLLAAAWSNCEQAQRFYADTRIREYYTQQRRLEIERLSGQLLPIDQCYINLVVVERAGDGNMERSDKEKPQHKPSPFSLFTRLKVDDSNKNKQVLLPELWNPRKMQDGTTARPRRVLIRGRAGVGKTTLCKKIVYDYLHHQLWTDEFDRLLWVPLRRLKGKREYKIEKLLSDIFFSQNGEDSRLVQVLSKTIWDPDHRRTLFILDGLDEVSRDWNSGSDMTDFLVDLLNRPNVIITSRPYGESLPGVEPFDLELETVGFYPDQVETYLRKTFWKPEDEIRAKEIQSFIQEHWLLQGLVRIPIQLDALCYSWNSDFQSGGVPKTMTTLYQAIELKLWKKDISRLEKSYEGKPLTEADIRALITASQIKSMVQSEITLLECLAFTGIYNDVIEFSAEYRSNIYEHFMSQEIPLLSDKILERLSFLRTSDSSSEDIDRSYHFLHLTIQEYFAAQYFVRHWKSRQPLCCLVLSGHQEDIMPERFLQKEKYNARFDIVWRFVAGLLQTCQDKEPLLRFFQTLEDEPRDLLGPAHQRLLMHCFSEVPRSDNKSTLENLRAEMENQLSQWLSFECALHGSMHLGAEMECPEQLLSTLLQKESLRLKTGVLAALTTRPRISSTLLHLMASWLGSDAPEVLQREAFQSLVHHLKYLPKDILKAVVSRLEHEDSNVRSQAAWALGNQPSLPEDILKALVSRLEDEDSNVRFWAAQVLHNQSSLTEDILKALVSQLEHEDSDVRFQAARVLGNQPSLPEDILKALVSQLEHEDSHVRFRATWALGHQSSLPEDIIKALVSQLEHEDSD